MTANVNIIKLLCLLVIIGCCSSCSHGYRFADRPPVTEIDDRRPIDLPKTTRYIRMDYYTKVLVRRPAVSSLRYPPKRPSRDVNAHDNVPASSWYTPRLGYEKISPLMLLRGPTEMGPPQPPVRVVSAKHSGRNPGFVIADSRDQLYLIKFDPREHPALETATAMIVNRLFWGFGYNVPEDHTFYFNSAEVPVDPTADITEAEVALVFDAVAPPDNGLYRATASRIIPGINLGPISDIGRRKDDPNDHFNHEDRRVLRALRVFAAFTNQTDIRIDNSMDVYIGPAGQGYLRHYLLDFGEAFGGQATKNKRLWDGYRHVFSFSEMFRNLFSAGFIFQDWEKIEPTQWPSVGVFESTYFDPANWREAFPFEPIRRSLAEDNYWAAKIVAAITREHLQMLILAGNYPEPEAADYVLQTLMERRQKVIDYFFGQVSPLELRHCTQDTLFLEDFGQKYGSKKGLRRYKLQYLNDRGQLLQPEAVIESQAGATQISVPLPAGILRKARGYLQINLRVLGGNRQPAAFHLRQRHDGTLRVAGIVH